MEQRKYSETPRERIDDELLAALLREEEPMSRNPSGYHHSDGYRNPAGCRSTEPPQESEYPNAVTRQESVPGTPGMCQCRGFCGGSVRKQNRSGTENSPIKADNYADTAESRQNEREKPHLAMVYSPEQKWEDLYGDDEALEHGTLFKKLDFPFWYACKSCGCGGSEEKQ